MHLQSHQNRCCLHKHNAVELAEASDSHIDLWHYWVAEIWTASSEFGTYRLCEQRRFRQACASTQSHQNLRCSLIQALNQEEPSDRKPDPWPLWMAGHAQLKFIMTECSKTQICLTGLIWLYSQDRAYYYCKNRKKPGTRKIGVNLFLKFEQCAWQHRVMRPKDAVGMANSVDCYQTAPEGVVWNGSTLFAKPIYLKT